MKLRLRGNSIRFRLTQSEVAELLEHGVVEETTILGGARRFTYRVVLDSKTDVLQSSDLPFGIELIAPTGLVSAWASSAEVGISNLESCSPFSKTHLLLEKDFRCLKPRAGEEDSDTFSNPRAE